MLIVSCNSSKTSSEQNDLKFDVILEHATGGRITKDIVIVTDINTLEAIYSDISVNHKPNYEIPVINFETELIVVFFMGEKNSGGYSISVNTLTESDNYINVNYQETSPEPTDMVTMAITQPYCIIKLKRPSKELKFVKSS